MRPPRKTKHKKKILLIRYDTENGVRKSGEVLYVCAKKNGAKNDNTQNSIWKGGKR